ncbi:polyglutamine-binding protein 1-like [Mytilus trossulus]|uniref:polyglutamine-binding protein 1-like n=1 Tax=Mytilus trossulus TaxID=6551 RepID=UPI0030046781
MPLPQALLARLQKRGIVKDEQKSADEVEEVFAEDYDDPVKEAEYAKPADIPEPQSEEEEDEEEEDGPLIHHIPACPNRSNKYHTCVDYCKEKWGMKEFQKDSDMTRKRDRMLGKYPLPDGWLEVADPETNRYYYWNLVTDQVSWLSPVHPSAQITLSADKIQAIFGDSAIVSSHDDDLHLSDDEEMDVNDSESSPSSSSSSDSDSDEEFERKRQRTDTNRQDDKRGGRGGGGGSGRGGAGRGGGGRGGRRNQNKKEELDPMDPASYSEVSRGSWSSGLDRGNEAKTGADTTASGPLFQQRPYPSPGEIMRRNQANKK